MFQHLREEIDGIMQRDPAARSRLEVLLCYPSLHAVLGHRAANWLWRHDWRLAGRFVAHLARILTAIDIHPGATIGKRLFIDHGLGVVIGETAEIGDDVTLYQGVTLGGILPSVDSAAQVDKKRHPTLQDGVIVGSGAQILGGFTVGAGARVGANSVVTHEVPPGATVVGIPARIANRSRPQAVTAAAAQPEFAPYGLPGGDCADPVAKTLEALRREVTALRARVEELEAQAPAVREAEHAQSR